MKKYFYSILFILISIPVFALDLSGIGSGQSINSQIFIDLFNEIETRLNTVEKPIYYRAFFDTNQNALNTQETDMKLLAPTMDLSSGDITVDASGTIITLHKKGLYNIQSMFWLEGGGGATYIRYERITNSIGGVDSVGPVISPETDRISSNHMATLAFSAGDSFKVRVYLNESPISVNGKPIQANSNLIITRVGDIP